jgi:glycosyltransferase involved in cell wall biosynthesis
MGRGSVNFTLPVHNEETQLEESVLRLLSYLEEHFHAPFEIVIVNNASTDRTKDIADDLSRRCEKVKALHLPEKGRGQALRSAWSLSSAEVLSYMDVDLSAELDGIAGLTGPLLSGRADLAVGSRLLRPSTTRRGLKRECLSRGYNLLLKTALQVRFSDAQCGFKSVTKAAAAKLLPRVISNLWFFDTELLVIAQRSGYRIYDFPVRWTDDPDSRVVLLPTVIEHLLGVLRLRWSLRKTQESRSFP